MDKLISTLFALVCYSLIPVLVQSLPQSPQCIDDFGSPVDWYIVYKFPHLKSMSHSQLFDGYHYAYISSKTVNNHDNGWHFSRHKINESKSIFGRTLEPYFSGNKSHLTAVFYNDQPPNLKVPLTYAHAKGIILTDSHQGFWLIHSIPKFIVTSHKYSFPKTGGRYGQIAMCISLATDELTKIVRQNFLISRPYIYLLYIDSTLERAELGRALIDLEHHRWIHGNYSELHLTSLGGKQFRSFYKSPSYEVDLYAGIVARTIKISLRVETWRHPPGNPLNSDCQYKQEEVENIERIQLSFIDSDLHGQFNSYDDHSKWAISRDHQHILTCIGDINRVHSQFHRGGGTTCLVDDIVWNNFNSFINKVNKCPDDS